MLVDGPKRFAVRPSSDSGPILPLEDNTLYSQPPPDHNAGERAEAAGGVDHVAVPVGRFDFVQRTLALSASKSLAESTDAIG